MLSKSTISIFKSNKNLFKKFFNCFLVRSSANLRKTLSEIHQIANEDILTSFIKSSAKRDKNHKLNLIKIANDNVEKKTETKIRKRKTITKTLNFENSNNYLHEKED